MLNSFKNRRVLITGHTGFKGSWLTIWLHRLGAKVAGYSLAPPTQPSNFEVSQVRELVQNHYEADIRDVAQLTDAFRHSQPEVVFHLAAQPLVRESYRSPRATFETNVMGTINVLEAVRSLGRPCAVVVITSDKCYENREQIWGYRECDPMGGHDPYSASKGATELVTASYRRSFFSPERLDEHHVQLATARAGNVIGGGDWAADRIVTDIMKALLAGETMCIRNPSAVRPWQHVLEPLCGYLTLAAHMLKKPSPGWCEAWNFGPLPGEERPVRELVETFLRCWGQGQWRDLGDPSQPHEAHLLRLSVDKAVAQLDWRPRWKLAQTIDRTAGWYRRYYADPKTRMLSGCLDDIAEYERL